MVAHAPDDCGVKQVRLDVLLHPPLEATVLPLPASAGRTTLLVKLSVNAQGCAACVRGPNRFPVLLHIDRPSMNPALSDHYLPMSARTCRASRWLSRWLREEAVALNGWKHGSTKTQLCNATLIFPLTGTISLILLLLFAYH